MTTTARPVAATRVVPEPRLPSVWRLGLARGAVEVRSLFRQRAALIFVFALPAILLVMFGLIFRDDHPAPGVSQGRLLTGGLIAAGIAATSFLNLGMGIAQDRDDGTLKRLRGTPVPATSYVLGKLIMVVVASLAEVALLMLVGGLFFDVPLPHGLARWATLAWVFVLGVTGCTLLGIAASRLAPNARSAPPVLNLILVLMEFVSGVFIVPITTLPSWMVTFASLFPLKWTAQGMRSVFLPDSMGSLEEAGTWEHPMTALVLGAWCVLGLVLCLATFRWSDRRNR